MSEPRPVLIARPGLRACWSVIGLTAVVAFVELQLLQPIHQLGEHFSRPDLAAALTLSALAALAGTVLLGAGRVFWILYGAQLELTEETLEIKSGVIARRRAKILLAHIRAIETDQNLVDRLLDTGTLELSTAGTNEMDVQIRYLNDPIEVRTRIRAAIEALAPAEVVGALATSATLAVE